MKQDASSGSGDTKGLETTLRRRTAMLMRLATAAHVHATHAGRACAQIDTAKQMEQHLQFRIQKAEEFLGITAHDAETAKQGLTVCLQVP